MSSDVSLGGLQVLDLLTALQAVGVGVKALCRVIDLAPTSLSEGTRVPSHLVAALFAEAERRTRDPLIGLHAGDRSEPRGALTFLVMSSPQLEDGLRQAVRFAGVMISGLRIEVESRGDHLSMVYRFNDAAIGTLRHLVDYLLLANLRGLQRAVPGTLRPREVHLPHAEPGGTAQVARIFGCPVFCSRPQPRLVFSRRTLPATTRFANPIVNEQIERFAASLLAQPAPPVNFRQRVTDLTRALVAAGVRADRATVARRLAVSDRTLLRALEAEGVTFREVRDGVLRDVAEAMLSNPTLKVETVAISTGFSDVAAFAKAFRRWAACTPTEYRARLSRLGAA